MQNFTKSVSSLFFRCRLPGAAILAAAAFLCLWTGFGLGDRIPLLRVAVAESVPAGSTGGLPDALSRDRALLLQSTVDSLALGLSGIFASEPFALAAEDGPSRRNTVAAALRVLTFRLGGEVYFTAWDGTQAVYSPLSPDAAAMDFADVLDADGKAFVQQMDRLALEGGGFLRVKLPRQLSPAAGQFSDDDALFTPEEPPALVRGGVSEVPEDMAEVLGSRPQTCPLHRPSACEGAPLRNEGSGEAVEQVVYVRKIPGLSWHLAAFSPAESRPAEHGFSRIWSGNGRDRARQEAEELFRKGLCVSGLSLAGLAGLMLTPSRKRESDGLIPPTGYWWDEYPEFQAAAQAGGTEPSPDKAA